MSDSEPIVFRPRSAGSPSPSNSANTSTSALGTAFNRQELSAILDVYGRHVARGEWRDYAIDFFKDKAQFSVFRRSSEVPLYRIVKDPSLARRQGAYSVVSATGLVLKRGTELGRVLRVLDKRLSVVG